MNRTFCYSLCFCVLVVPILTGCGSKQTPGEMPKAQVTPEEIKSLIKLVNQPPRKTPGMDMRTAAAMRLGDMGAPAKEQGAIPALEKLARDPSEVASKAAKDALEKLKAL